MPVQRVIAHIGGRGGHALALGGLSSPGGPLWMTWCAHQTSARTLVHKSRVDQDLAGEKPKPWPYKERKYTLLNEMTGTDITKWRFDGQTKLVCIEGLPCSGKTEFAKRFAEEFDFKYTPDSDLAADLYIRDDGFDYRTLNHMLPETVQALDIPTWAMNPHHKRATIMQCHIYQLRYFSYLDDLAHIFNTGQGVVRERALWSLEPWVQATTQVGYTHPSFDEYCTGMLLDTAWEWLFKPHLIIYLDIPVELAYERLQKKYPGNKAFTMEFLRELDKRMKRNFLKPMKAYSEILCYDWTEPADWDYVIEDVENVDFEGIDPHTDKCKQWRFIFDEEYNIARKRFSNMQWWFGGLFNRPYHNVEGMWMHHEDRHLQTRVYTNYAFAQTEDRPRGYVPPDWDPRNHSWFKLIFGIPNYRKRQWHLAKSIYANQYEEFDRL